MKCPHTFIICFNVIVPWEKDPKCSVIPGFLHMKFLLIKKIIVLLNHKIFDVFWDVPEPQDQDKMTLSRSYYYKCLSFLVYQVGLYFLFFEFSMLGNELSIRKFIFKWSWRSSWRSEWLLSQDSRLKVILRQILTSVKNIFPIETYIDHRTWIWKSRILI